MQPVLYAKCHYYLVLYTIMQECPYYLVLYMQGVRIISALELYAVILCNLSSLQSVRIL